MKNHYLKIVSSLFIIILLVSTITNANKISNKKSDIIIDAINQSSLEGDLDPNVNINIKVTNEAIVLLPKKRAWAPLFESLNHFEKDFKIERNQPKEEQKREPMFR